MSLASKMGKLLPFKPCSIHLKWSKSQTKNIIEILSEINTLKKFLFFKSHVIVQVSNAIDVSFAKLTNNYCSVYHKFKPILEYQSISELSHLPRKTTSVASCLTNIGKWYHTPKLTPCFQYICRRRHRQRPTWIRSSSTTPATIFPFNINTSAIITFITTMEKVTLREGRERYLFRNPVIKLLWLGKIRNPEATLEPDVSWVTYSTDIKVSSAI